MLNWHTTKFAQTAETASKVMACAALFSIILPTALPGICLALFLLFSIIAGNYKFKLQLIVDNLIALIAIAIFILLILGLLYTSASIEDAQYMLKKYSKFIYIPLLLSAFHEQRWKQAGYIAFLSSMSLMLLMSYITLLGWSPESIYAGTYAGHDDEHIVFRSRIAHGTLMAYAAYLYIYHAIDNKRFRVLFVTLAILASFNVLAMVASRTGQLLWIILMLLLICQNFNWKQVILGLVIIPALMITVIYSSEVTKTRAIRLYNNMQLIKQGNYQSSVGRRIIWAQAGWDIFKRNPIVGTGTGSFETELKRYIQKNDIANGEHLHTQNPHNGYVSIGVQSGLVGLIFLAVLFIQQWRISANLPMLYRYIAQGMVVTIVMTNFLNSAIFSHTQGLFFATFTALLFSAYRSGNFNETAERQVLPPRQNHG